MTIGHHSPKDFPRDAKELLPGKQTDKEQVVWGQTQWRVMAAHLLGKSPSEIPVIEPANEG